MRPEITTIRSLAAERVLTRPGGKQKKEKEIKDLPLGVFDSGVGGLTVLSQVMRHLPHEDVIYLADNARVPYGGRPPEEIIKINKEILDFFEETGVKLVIMACGTSSSIAYPGLKDKYDFHIISLIEPGAHTALAVTENSKIGVFATVGTIKSQAFKKMLISMRPEVSVVSEACPLFVPLIEGGFVEAEETERVAKEYLKPLIKEKVDTLILGCTHYPHLLKVLKKLAPELHYVDPAEEAVTVARQYLVKNHLLKDKTRPAHYNYLATGNAAQFKELGSKLLGKPIAKVKQIKLG